MSPSACTIRGCDEPGLGRARVGDLCRDHWSAWESSEERRLLRGDRIQDAPDAWFRFVARQERLEALFTP